jgi:hypothetical protein
LFVHIYNQQGVSIGHYNLELLHPKERLLEQALIDVNKEATAPPRQKPFAAPLSVYYVNCDVDGPPTQVAMNDPVDMPRPEPAPQATPPVSQVAAKPAADSVLDFLSNPSGADIYVDGLYVGKTPFSLAVAVGEHAVLIRKQDFSSWQQRLQAAPGKRRVFAFLEQKTLNLE